MSDEHDNLPAADGQHRATEPDAAAHADPGVPAHLWRPTDVDPRAEKRAERQVALLFALSILCTILFVVAYFALEIGDDHDTFAGLGASNVALGSTLGGALLFLGIGIIHWARKLMADHELIEMRHPSRSSDEARAETAETLQLGLEESGMGRRPLIRNLMIGAMALLGVPAVVALRDLGPTPAEAADDDEPGSGLETTLWTKGMRVVRDVIGTPIRVTDLEIGDLVNGEPEALFTGEDGEPLEGVELQVGKSKGAVIVVRMEPDEIIAGDGRENWSVDGILCYSKICTHVGCPISLYEQQTHHVLCPCHQSTFDLADSARVIFGPAARPLPQLPLMVDEEGYLVAQSDFREPVGPSYWERDSG